MKWGSDDDVRAYDWAENDVYEAMSPEPPDEFSQDRYDARMADLHEAEARLNWVQRRTFYINHKTRKW